MAWYVIITNPQCERKAARSLRREGVRVYLPVQSQEHRHRRTKEASVKFRPLLVGYLFIRFPAAMVDRRGVPSFGALKDCQGVKRFLCSLDGRGEFAPIALTSSDVALIMRRQRSREFGRAEVENLARKLAQLRKVFQPGRTVRIVDGPFANFLAVLKKLKDDTTIEVEIDIFGRPTKATVNIPEIVPVDDPQPIAA